MSFEYFKVQFASQFRLSEAPWLRAGGVCHRRLRAFHGLAAEDPPDPPEGGEENEYVTFPVEVLPLSDQQMADLAWEENSKRKDLTAIEEAEALRQAIELFGYTQAEIGERWGLSQSAVANKLRLLNLPKAAREAIKQGDLTEKHGRALLAALGKSQRIYEEAAQKIIPAQVEQEAAERARALVNSGENWFETSRVPDGLAEKLITQLHCEACDRAVWRINLFFSPFYKTRDVPDKPRNPGEPAFGVLCRPCYQVGSGWEPPSGNEAADIVRRVIGQISVTLRNARFPLDVQVGEGATGVVSGICAECPAREEHQKGEWVCLDRSCFETKERIWKDFQLSQLYDRLRHDYGEAGSKVVVFEGYQGQDLRADGVDAELIKNGICVPGKCVRLRLKRDDYISDYDIQPYKDLPYIWNCDNGNAHSACQRRYLASQQPEDQKTEAALKAEMIAERKRQARAVLDQAVASVAKGLTGMHVGAWRALAEDLSVKPRADADAQELVVLIAGRLFHWQKQRISGSYTDSYWEGEADPLPKFREELYKKLEAWGVGRLPGVVEITQKLEAMYEFVYNARLEETITPEQVKGNWKNLEKLAEAARDLELEPEERQRLFNQIHEMSDELWEAAQQVGLEVPQESMIISQEIGDSLGF